MADYATVPKALPPGRVADMLLPLFRARIEVPGAVDEPMRDLARAVLDDAKKGAR